MIILDKIFVKKGYLIIALKILEKLTYFLNFVINIWPTLSKQFLN